MTFEHLGFFSAPRSRACRCDLVLTTKVCRWQDLNIQPFEVTRGVAPYMQKRSCVHFENQAEKKSFFLKKNHVSDSLRGPN